MKDSRSSWRGQTLSYELGMLPKVLVMELYLPMSQCSEQDLPEWINVIIDEKGALNRVFLGILSSFHRTLAYSLALPLSTMQQKAILTMQRKALSRCKPSELGQGSVMFRFRFQAVRTPGQAFFCIFSSLVGNLTLST